MTNPMTPLTGLTDVNEYLDTRHHIDKNVTGNINDFGRVVFQAGYDYSTKEILCNLLSGRGLLLPNLQICLSMNLKAMLGVTGLQTQLIRSLSKLDTAFDNYLEHTSISNVLGRLDSALSEVSQIANMINFCGKPITPIPITNSLENAMQSFLGKGKSLIDQIGSMIPDQVGGCLAFDGHDFNLSLFGGGILGDLANLWDRAKSGQLTTAELDLFDNRITDAIAAIDSLIADENNTTSVVEYGGSDFNNNYDVPLNLELGVVHNPSAVGIQGNAAIASQLQSLYDKFAGYPVIDANGKIYDNIFKLIIDDNLIRLLQTPSNPTPTIATREPIYNYCGDIVGYNTVIAQQENVFSEGIPPVDSAISANPGFKSNGLDTSAAAQISDVSGNIADLTANAITKSTLLGTANQITVITSDEINSTTTIAAVVATQAQAEAKTDNISLMTPLRTAQEITASIATQALAEAKTDNTTLMTPLRTAQEITASIATQALAQGGVDSTTLMTPERSLQQLRANNIISGTAVATTSGTLVDFTNIPSWVKRITIMLSGVSTNGSNSLRIQIGTVSAIETTGYVGQTLQFTTAAVTQITTTAGILLDTGGGGTASVYGGSVTLNNLTGNIWVATGFIVDDATNLIAQPCYTKTLSDKLGWVQLNIIGTNTFDAGNVNILME